MSLRLSRGEMALEFMKIGQVRGLRALAWGLAGVVLAALALGWAASHARGLLLHLIIARTQREARIDGPFELHLLTRHPLLRAQLVAIGNPPWMEAGVTARAQVLTLRLRWQLSLVPLALQRLEAQGVELTLVRDEAGYANWHLSREGPGRGPPLVRGLDVPDADVTLRDQRRHLDFSGVVSALDHSDLGEPGGLQMHGQGRLNGRAATFAIEGEPLASVRRDTPYHFALQESSGEARLSAHLEVPHPFDMRSLHGPFEVSGPTFADLYFLVGLHLPQSGPFTLSGSFEREQKRFVYRELAAHFGQSDLGGTLQVDSSTGRPQVSGGLKSHLLNLSDIGKASQASAPGLAADTPHPLNVAALKRSDWNVTFNAGALQLGSQLLKPASASLSIEQGVLRAQQVRAGLAGGEIAAEARLDVTPSVPQGTLEVRLRGLQLSELHPSDRPGVSGELSARAKLTGEGKSFHDLLSTANGTAAALLPGGTLPAAAVELASLDLNGVVGALLKSRAPTPIRCGVVSFEVQDGVAVTHTLLLDTQDVLISGSGEIHLDSEALDITLQGHPKHPRLALHSPVLIGGTLRHPQVRLEGKGALVQAGAAVALGVALTPLAALLAFVNPGLAHNADCAQLLEEARASVAAPAAKVAQAPHPH
jgi:AsmA family protein